MKKQNKPLSEKERGFDSLEPSEKQVGAKLQFTKYTRCGFQSADVKQAVKEAYEEIEKYLELLRDGTHSTGLQEKLLWISERKTKIFKDKFGFEL